MAIHPTAITDVKPLQSRDSDRDSSLKKITLKRTYLNCDFAWIMTTLNQSMTLNEGFSLRLFPQQSTDNQKTTHKLSCTGNSSKEKFLKFSQLQICLSCGFFVCLFICLFYLKIGKSLLKTNMSTLFRWFWGDLLITYCTLFTTTLI